ncbi:glycosyltransferase [uncultured Nisaea sp.]|uniref:glycosyltransferase n=1 Tax=uncultured Nisaea sp. TaxID=538215 RepID=UPI0030EF28E7|tara:strand:- start:270 stop:2963 length:2694 start_codon:yes stop_codon:yes gene_type:complete
MLGAAEAFQRAQAALADGKPDEAARLFRLVSEQAKNDAASLIHLGQIETSLGHPRAAKEAWQKALLRQPSNASALAFIADHLAAGAPDISVAPYYERLRILLPRHAGPARLLAQIYGAAKQTGRSLKRHAEAARLDAGNPDAHARHASALHGANRLTEALQAFRREALLAPAAQEAWFNLSVIEPALGDREQGLAAIARSLTLRPLDAPALARQAQLRRRLGKPGADASTRRSILLDPAVSRALVTPARTGDAQAAAHWWCISQGTEPGMLHMRALITAGRADQALAVLGEMETGDTAPDEILLLAAEAQRQTGRTDLSLPKTQYQQWLDSLPPSEQEVPAETRTFSILLPVYNPNPAHLREAIQSVLDQSYGRWELCIADDASSDPEVARILREAAAADPRIKLVTRAENGHISAASNSALELATGSFIGLLDHDDRLAPDALAETARALEAHPDLDLIYSDEDKIDANGNRFSPHFKPAWDPDLSLISNYICHFTIIRRMLVEAVGGFRIGYEGSQDHDLVQRVAERSTPSRIGHIPRVLYHWRAAGESTATSIEAKPYAIAATGRVIRDALVRRGANARPEQQRGRWRLLRPRPNAHATSVIIPTRNRVNLLKTCIDGLLTQTDYSPLDIHIVDNGSDDPETLRYLDLLSHRVNISILRDNGAFNFSRLCNLGARETKSDHLCFLNNDIEPANPDWLTELVAEAARPEIGLVGAKLLYPDRTVQHAGIAFSGEHVARHTNIGISQNDGGYWGRAMQAQSLSAVTGACMVMRRKVFEEVGGFDEALAVDFGDIDLCLRVRKAGYRILWTPHALLIHHESASRGSVITPEKAVLYDLERAFMVDRWGTLLDDDPAYNPNLCITPERPAFTLPEKPRPLQAIVRTGSFVTVNHQKTD